MKKIVVIGAGEFGRELIWLLEDINRRELKYIILGFLDDNTEKIGREVSGYKVLGTSSHISELNKENDVFAVIAMQDGLGRKKIVEGLSGFQNWETVIHPSVVAAQNTKVGRGCVICANVSISVSSEIGGFSLLNIGAIVGHDCQMGNYVSVMSNVTICGDVTIGEGAYIATQSSIIPGRILGEWCQVGVNSAVMTNIKAHTKVFGSPAKRILL